MLCLYCVRVCTSISGIWSGFATEAVNLCWNQNTHEGRKFAGRFAGKDANCCAFVSQPKQPLVKARSGRRGSERIAAAAVVLFAGSRCFAADHPQYSLSRTDDTEKCFQWWCPKGGLESITSKSLIHCFRLLVMPSPSFFFLEGAPCRIFWPCFSGCFLWAQKLKDILQVISWYLLVKRAAVRAESLLTREIARHPSSVIGCDRHVVQSIESDSEDLPRVNPEDVEDLEWISQSLGVSLRFVVQWCSSRELNPANSSKRWICQQHMHYHVSHLIFSHLLSSVSSIICELHFHTHQFASWCCSQYSDCWGIITSTLCVSQILTQTNLTWGFQGGLESVNRWSPYWWLEFSLLWQSLAIMHVLLVPRRIPVRLYRLYCCHFLPLLCLLASIYVCFPNQLATFRLLSGLIYMI